ncbi:CD83 antigen [Periophthalmus magnuspinnatus]|uniref:CD83 antigen n=1 Tax=Periophthalmus magnuspinnatus TaxID=409849 RepID=UPI002436E402|nr:CD83 antigen [Periophthalmus magnuspinnatus]
MLPLLTLLFELLVPYSAQEQIVNIEAKCGTDASLPCNADFSTNKYFSLTWYKHDKEGIIRIALENKQRRYYGFPRDMTLDEQNYSLLLPKVTPADSGRYECAVSAKPGGQNLKLHVMLTVPECEPDVTTSATTVQVGETERTLLNVTQPQHLPLTWSLVGYSAIALTKILLSMMIIWVFHICSRPKRRRCRSLIREKNI